MTQEHWRATVMTDEQMAQVIHLTKSNGKLEHKLVKAQAEITGDIAEQEGMRKVVEWIDKHPVFIQSNSLGIKVPIAVDPEWQAQLKEWGIDVVS